MTDALTLNTLYQQIKKRFAENGIDNAALDARLLICHALELTHENFVLRGHDAITQNQIAAIEELIVQRLAGRPVAKIIGHKEFYGRVFKTTDDTLDPRPDSETLIDTVLRYVDECHARDAALRILDLGTGTGCLILTLLSELPNAVGIAVDQSAAALMVAHDNADALDIEERITFMQSDWFEHVGGVFDIIISNPPYIAEDDLPALAIEVREFDPYTALVGGQDGLDPYRIIIPQLDGFLKPSGFAAFELGQGQDGVVAEMLQNAGFKDVRTDYDLGGIGRIVSGLNLKD